MPEVSTSQDPVAEARGDILLVGAFQCDGELVLSPDALEVDEAHSGQLSNFLRGQGFDGSVGDLVAMPTPQIVADSVGVVGLGNETDLDVTQLRRAAGSSVRRLNGQRSIATTLHRQVPGEESEAGVVEGMLLGGYRFDLYKTHKVEPKLERISLLGATNDAVRRGSVRAAAIKMARDLINEPASSLNPASLAERAQAMAERSNLECTVLDEKELEQRGFGGIIAVGKGSDSPPRLVQLHYSPPSPKGQVTLVGKGITFDAGGLSMKSIEQMEDMKTDMSGAAATLGAMSALNDLGVAVEVTCLVPSAENMLGGRALKPGDVIHHYGGKTSEVLNTDAEGRLVLADALALASEQTPDAMVDVATLTGAIVTALGLRAAGIFCEDEDLRGELLAASASAGERFWWMPIYLDYRDQLDSEVADIKNVATKWGGAIFAANFLGEFVDPKIPWAHLDIAGSARSEEDRFEITKGGTGVAAGTLMTWLESRGR